MLHKKLKYLTLLAQIQNCPPNDFEEVNIDAYRWVHTEENENDFKPINLIKSPPQRILDADDLHCMGYGLSMFDTLENALNKYKKMYNGKRVNQKDIFVEDVGTVIAALHITEEDGMANVPCKTNYGHFTFHEYEGVDLRSRISSSLNIFKDDGEYSS